MLWSWKIFSREDIQDEAPLFGDDGLGLDSIDALELGIALLRKKYLLKLEDNDAGNREVFPLRHQPGPVCSDLARASWRVEHLSHTDRGAMNEEQILAKLKTILGEAFEISPERIVPEAKLFELELTASMRLTSRSSSRK